MYRRMTAPSSIFFRLSFPPTPHNNLPCRLSTMSSDSEDLLRTLYGDYRSPIASTLHGNLQTDTNPESRRRDYRTQVMRPTRPPHNREGPSAPRPLSTTSIRDENGILRRERVKWGDSTFNLPYVPAQSDKQEDKKTVLDDTVRDEFPPDVVASCTRVGHFPN